MNPLPIHAIGSVMQPSHPQPPSRATERLAATAAGLARAAELLRSGRLVAFATETVYGLGGDGTDDRAVAGIFAAKDRPRFNPLILHLADPDRAADFALMPPRARAAAAAFWPGPLTLVLPLRPDSRISRLATAGLDTVALRVPDHATARALLRATGRPIAAPSANRSGRLSPTAAGHVLETLDGRIDAVLDAGPARVGVESTVLDLTGDRPVLLRAGGVAERALAAVLGPIARDIDPDMAAGEPAAPRSPGRVLRHYAPLTPIRLDAVAARPGEALLGFGSLPDGGPAGSIRNLSPGGDITEAAANLFAMLHDLDRLRPAAIAVMPIPDRGLGLAVNDRLRRAAAAQASG